MTNYTDSAVPLPIKYRRRRSDRDILQELMPYRIREVLLVANYYDSYNIIKEDRFSEKIFGEYLQLNLFSAPRITSATTWEEVKECMAVRNYDLVIIMSGVDKQMPLDISRRIRMESPFLPVLLLVNNNSDLKFFDDMSGRIKDIDRVFVWNGDSRVFLAMIKYMEDKMNVDIDVQIGDVRVILLVEDSQRYYSRYLPLLYSIIFQQTQAILTEESPEQPYAVLKLRVRPKILLAGTYEEAVEIVDRFKNNLLCVISDVEFSREGVSDPNAGLELINYVHSIADLPILLQSSDPANAINTPPGVDFLDKNSDVLSQSISEFIHQKLGFGSFQFTTSRGVITAVAHNIAQFEECLRTVPAESLIYHGKRHGISKWLMARGEISLAKRLRTYKVEDFESTNQFRQFVVDCFDQLRYDRLRGMVVHFNPKLEHQSHFVMRIGEGSLGGKGRGLAFLCNYIENVNFDEIIPDMKIAIPPTTIIGAEEYSNYISNNDLYGRIIRENDYEKVKELFLEAELTAGVKEQLRSYVENYNVPLAIRSSGLFEDSLLQPFAGVYSTYVLPNNHPDVEVRFRQLQDAVKLIYASIFSDAAKAYLGAVNYKIEEEKMAVIIQHLVGQRINGKFYPNISGVAQSFNYYPLSYMKPEDGFAVLCVGLGKYVVGGEKSWRFCPSYPKLDINSLPDQIKDSQTHFYALNLDNPNIDMLHDGEDAAILRLPVKEAEEDGSLKYCASVYDYEYDMLVHDFSRKGPRVLNFSNILKYDAIPLARSIELLLHLFKEAMGSPVEIEFAVDFEGGNDGKPVLYLLQIKPLIRLERHADIDIESIDKDSIWLRSSKGMGNGWLKHIQDVVFMNIDEFDRTKTSEMAMEIEQINRSLEAQQREYILIGPGRWGTHDRFTGIPVYWSQISKARVIVEMGLESFPLDASLGSHFFHNVTSMNVGYFSVFHHSDREWIDMEFLKTAEVVQRTRYFIHARFESPCEVLMDGKSQQAVILRPQNDNVQ